MSALGARLSAAQIQETLSVLWDVNAAAEDAGRWTTPTCIWGEHGIGKTMLVEGLAKERNMAFAYCAPAQFEEMGDLNGMPVITGDQTTFAPPKWVPKEEGPGVLLLDDLNRADDRILRGLMQLIQTGGLVSWRLPPGWQIVATANPDNADYSVTAMDDAMLTRFRHITMEFDVNSWVRWAKANDVDKRGIDFVQSYPELSIGRRTTPRSLTSFFESIRNFPDLRSKVELVHTFGMASLDESTVVAFIAFIHEGILTLPSPEEILDAEDFKAVCAHLKEVACGEDDELKIDRLNVVCTRLVDHLLHSEYTPGDRDQDNLTRFFFEAPIPGDMLLATHRKLIASDKLRSMLSSPALAKKLLEFM